MPLIMVQKAVMGVNVFIALRNSSCTCLLAPLSNRLLILRLESASKESQRHVLHKTILRNFALRHYSIVTFVGSTAVLTECFIRMILKLKMRFFLQHVYLDIFCKNGPLLTVISSLQNMKSASKIFRKTNLPLLPSTNTLQIIKQSFIPNLTDENGNLF